MSQPAEPAPPRLRLDVRRDVDAGVPWRPVSARLIRVRSLTAAIGFGLLALVLLLLTLVLWDWFWVPTALVVVGWVAYQLFVVRQVRAISWAELEDELAIRKGRMFRQLVTIPYGRIQYVDVEAGPLLRAHGLASIEVHTASPASSGDIPGLPEGEAEALRERLTSLGESRRAGL